MRFENMDAFASSQVPTAMLSEMFFAKDTVMVGTLVSLGHLGNRKLSSGLEKQRVDQFLAQIREKDNLGLIDEAEQIFINYMEAITGRGGKSMLYALIRYDAAWGKLKQIYENGELGEINYAEALEKTSSISITPYRGEARNRVYWVDAQGRLHLSQEALELIRAEVGHTLLDGEICSLLQ